MYLVRITGTVGHSQRQMKKLRKQHPEIFRMHPTTMSQENDVIQSVHVYGQTKVDHRALTGGS